ncbi:MAG: 2-succinyl-5-enolpyruvyl-6-hydroxy-3-cyclohexene-1-carboxylic-acid synthase, partial [bacterium]|nr:2-succinyl-5-enolpyruvyl-6-hydroxy-3-cyclohexene-1-carboxylic-acid synthase [bacterium]
SQSEVPLLVLTADRPPELRNVGAPQTIDQVSLYGSSPRLFIDVATPQETKLPDAVGLAGQAWAAATHRIPGPVHVNLPFREPLLDRAPIPRSGPAVAPPAAVTTALDLAELARRVSGKKGLIVAGRSNDAEFPVACSALAEATGFPVFADPLSGLRYGTHSLELVLEHGDAIAAAGVLDRQRPDLVLRFGPVPTSKPVWTWLAA